MGTYKEPFFHMIKGESLHLRGADGECLRKLRVNDINEELGIKWFQHKTDSSYEPICDLDGYQCYTDVIKIHRLPDKQQSPNHWEIIFTHWPYKGAYLTVYVKNVYED